MTPTEWTPEQMAEMERKATEKADAEIRLSYPDPDCEAAQAARIRKIISNYREMAYPQ